MSADQYFLSRGSHPNGDEGRCAMEWVSFIAGEKHTDQPVCVSPVLRSFCIRFNDRLGDEDRQKLRPYLARCIGTAGDGMDEQRRTMLRDWLIREAMPRWMDLAGGHVTAERLRTLPGEIAEEDVYRILSETREEAYELRTAARARLRAKYGSGAVAVAAAAAAADAVADAAAAAAADAAADAAAVAAAVAAADAVGKYNATYDAVYKQVKARAFEAIKPTADELNRSAFDLLDRMLPTVPVSVPALSDVAEELVRV